MYKLQLRCALTVWSHFVIQPVCFVPGHLLSLPHAAIDLTWSIWPPANEYAAESTEDCCLDLG